MKCRQIKSDLSSRWGISLEPDSFEDEQLVRLLIESLIKNPSNYLVEITNKKTGITATVATQKET